MTFFGDLFEVAGGGASGFAAGMRAQREQQLERDNLRMQEAEMEAAAVDRSLMRGIQQQQVQLAEEEFQHQRAMDRRESLRSRMEARDGKAQQQLENELAFARYGFDPSGNPLSYNELPLTDRALIDQRQASAAAGRQFGDREKGLAQQVLFQFGQQSRDRLDYPAMEQRARELAEAGGMDPAAVLNALNAETGEYLLGRMTMDPTERMVEDMFSGMAFTQPPNYVEIQPSYNPAPSTASGGQVGGDVTLSGNLPPEVQAAIDELVAQGITDPNEVMAELSKRGLGN